MQQLIANEQHRALTTNIGAGCDLAMLALQQWRDRLPPWLQRLAERPAWLWNTGIGLIIGLCLLRWLLQR